VALKNLEYWVLAQVGLEVVLVLLLVFFLIRIRSMSRILKNSQGERKEAAGNLERFSDQLARLDAKRLALEETLGLLSEKASGLQEQNFSCHGATDSFDPFPPRAKGSSLRQQVEDLHLQGFSTAEIAHRLGLHPTEVKMALELGRLKPK